MIYLINAGYDNYINDKKVLTVVDYSNSKPWPVQRAIKDAKDGGILIDVTMGKVTKSAIFTDAGYIILSALSGPTLTKRIQEARNACSTKET